MKQPAAVVLLQAMAEGGQIRVQTAVRTAKAILDLKEPSGDAFALLVVCARRGQVQLVDLLPESPFIRELEKTVALLDDATLTTPAATGRRGAPAS